MTPSDSHRARETLLRFFALGCRRFTKKTLDHPAKRRGSHDVVIFRPRRLTVLGVTQPCSKCLQRLVAVHNLAAEHLGREDRHAADGRLGKARLTGQGAQEIRVRVRVLNVHAVSRQSTQAVGNGRRRNARELDHKALPLELPLVTSEESPQFVSLRHGSSALVNWIVTLPALGPCLRHHDQYVLGIAHALGPKRVQSTSASSMWNRSSSASIPSVRKVRVKLATCDCQSCSCASSQDTCVCAHDTKAIGAVSSVAR